MRSWSAVSWHNSTIVGHLSLRPSHPSTPVRSRLHSAQKSLCAGSVSSRSLSSIHATCPQITSRLRKQPLSANCTSKSLGHASRLRSPAIRALSTSRISSFNTRMNPCSPALHRAFIALGSNVGDRFEMIEKACAELERANIRVRRTSSLFETAPMYVLDQDPFINGVCEVETSLSPLELLDTLQSIEIGLGRKKLIDKGPRSIDLDILLYDQQTVSHERLDIPHKLMLERDFVLRPLCQLIPHELPPFPGHNRTFLSHLKSLPPPSPAPVATTYISKDFPPLHSTDPKRPTHVMAILNLTPDSFSDGGKHFTTDLSALTTTVRDFIAAGATIIDIGGESTRPGSQPVGEAEELARVIPAIRHIRTAIPEAANIAISIDTYRARVAEEACAAGADIINDVSAGLLDPEMLPTMARTGKAVILMHMRGTPSTMTKLTDYPNGLIQDVSTELLDRVAAAEAAGVKRWRIILDPGLGFAKNQAQDLTILRDLQKFRSGVQGLEYFPWLMGPSRKRFIGRLTGVDKASDRGWGTAATVTASIAGGADIVRVHDVHEMWQVAKVADAIYRVEQ